MRAFSPSEDGDTRKQVRVPACVYHEAPEAQKGLMMNQFQVRCRGDRLFLEEWRYCEFGTNYAPVFRKWLL